MNDSKNERADLNWTKCSRDYYVHLLVGITETRHCLATLREYVLSAWQDGDQSDNDQSSRGSTSRLIMKLVEQFGLQLQTLHDDTQLVTDCLQSLKHKVTVWDKEMQLRSKSNLESAVFEDKRNVKCINSNNKLISEINNSLQKNPESVSNQSINNNDILPLQKLDETGYLVDDQDYSNDLQKQVNDLISQIESQHEQMNSLLRANRNYREDYRNKVRSMHRSMSIRMAAMNRSVMEVLADGISNKSVQNNKYDHLLSRINNLNSQLSEKKKEIQTLKNIINYNRCNSDQQLKKLQDELYEYQENSELSQSVHTEGNSKDFNDLQTNFSMLEQENTNLRHLLSLEVTEKLKLLNRKCMDQALARRHSLPGRVENEISTANHIYPLRKQNAFILT